MPVVKLSEFLRREIKPFLYGVFLSRIMESSLNGQKYFYAYTSFKSSKYVFRDDFYIKDYVKNEFVDELNHFSGYYNWRIHSVSETSGELRFYILNDLNISKTQFYKLLYQSLIQQDWVNASVINEQEKAFIRGFMESRGSVDTSRKLIAQDYFYENKQELKKAMILVDMMNLPIEYANFNARDLQPQFVSGENKRNAQFRINAFYYANRIGFINKYKALIFQKVYWPRGSGVLSDKIQYFYVEPPRSRDDDATFIRYLNFFSNNIYEKDLNSNAIATLRRRLGFKSSDLSGERTERRSRSLIELFNQITPDKCAVCGTTTTFTNRTTGRQHFEVHHVISYYNGQEVDNIANLVKLCPTCHDMLKRGRSPKETQMRAILKILHEHSEIFEFTSSYLGIDDINELGEKIWSLLG